jgi:alpha-mannosidase
MLADHAWNGTDARNKRHNADLRRGWCLELGRLAQKIQDRAWVALAVEPSNQDVLIFNPLSVSRRELVRVEAPVGNADVISGRSAVSSQIVEEDGGRYLYFAPHTMPPFSLAPYELRPTTTEPAKTKYLRATGTELESPYYKLAVDPKTGGLASLIHKASKADLVQKGAGRSFCQTVYFDGREHTLEDVKSEVVAEGAVLARLRITGNTDGLYVTTFVTVYERVDRVDFDVRVQKPAADREERLCHVFPVMGEGSDLRVETTGAVIRPRVQPEGNLVQGADTRRLAVQGFVDVSTPRGPGVTIAPLDAFALRLDLGQVTFEALGNDQNYREVIQDQGGATQFRFRYSVRGYEGPYSGPDAFAWSRAAAYPFLTARARLGKTSSGGVNVMLDPKRAITTCLKPADGDAALGLIMRIWETADRPGPTVIGVSGFKEAWRTDLLERDVGEKLPIEKGQVTLDLPARGLTSLRLVR